MDIFGIDLQILDTQLARLTPNIYLQAFMVLLLFFIIAELTTLILGKVFMQLAKKTKTSLDDRLITNIKNPLSLLFIFIGIKLAVNHIGLGMARLYPGSWSHWITDKERPISLGD